MGLAREITKLVKRLFRIETAKIRTNTVCQVVSYDASTNLATIQPCIQQIRTDDLDSINKTLKPIEDVPVWQWGSGTVLATVAPVADSYGLYVVSDRRLENWITLGGIQPPGSAIKHDISSGFFLPGLWPNVTGEKISPAVDTTGFQIRTMDGTGYISLNATTGIVDISGNTDAAALASLVDTLWSTLYTLLTTWTPVPNDGGAAFKAAAIAAFPTPPATTASIKLKIDS